jgi:nitrite reductase (NO-forming)
MIRAAMTVLCVFSFCISLPAAAQQHNHPATASSSPKDKENKAAQPAKAEAGAQADMHAPKVFTLRSGIAEGRMVYLGAGGDINGQVNPILKVHEGEIVQINLINGEGAEHDVVVDQYAARSNRVAGKNASSSLSFTANKTGEFVYYCSVPGHREAGMEGRIHVMPGPRAPAVATAPDIVRDPTDLPPQIHTRPAQVVHVDLETIELTGQLDDKTTYNYWTFNGKIPGPFIRVRAGDTVEVRLKNRGDSVLIHSVDFHAALGPGGGAMFTQTDPGAEKTVTFKALVPGLFVYHCATPSVAHHITNGMYGLILVEPEGGLPQVDREFYVMQGELYTAPNFTSSFHVIGAIFDHVYEGASLGSPPLTGVQTVSVPPGGATIVDFKIARAGQFTLVDHALSRLERGLAGFLIVEGPHDDGIMHQGPATH